MKVTRMTECERVDWRGYSPVRLGLFALMAACVLIVVGFLALFAW